MFYDYILKLINFIFNYNNYIVPRSNLKTILCLSYYSDLKPYVYEEEEEEERKNEEEKSNDENEEKDKEETSNDENEDDSVNTSTPPPLTLKMLFIMHYNWMLYVDKVKPRYDLHYKWQQQLYEKEKDLNILQHGYVLKDKQNSFELLQQLDKIERNKKMQIILEREILQIHTKLEHISNDIKHRESGLLKWENEVIANWKLHMKWIEETKKGSIPITESSINTLQWMHSNQLFKYSYHYFLDYTYSMLGIFQPYILVTYLSVLCLLPSWNEHYRLFTLYISSIGLYYFHNRLPIRTDLLFAFITTTRILQWSFIKTLVWMGVTQLSIYSIEYINTMYYLIKCKELYSEIQKKILHIR